MKTTEAKSYDEIYAELRPNNLSLDQYDIHELVGQAYADQQVLNYKTQLRKEVNQLLVITGSTQYVKVIELLDKI